VRLLPERKKAESANVPNAFPLIQQKRTHFSGSTFNLKNASAGLLNC
jgi:hypothetical protein